MSEQQKDVDEQHELSEEDSFFLDLERPHSRRIEEISMKKVLLQNVQRG